MSLIKSGVHDGVLIALVSEGRLTNEATLKQLGTDLVKLAAGCAEKKMLVNFEPVKFMSSAMLGQLVVLHKKCKELEVNLRFCGIIPDIMQVFSLTRLDKLFQINATEAEAMGAFNPKPGWFG